MRAHRFAHERPDGGRMRPAAHGDKTDLAPDFRLGQRARDAVLPGVEAIARHESETEAGPHHCKNPIVAFTAIHALHFRALLRKDIAGKLAIFAIDAVEVALAVE